MGKKSNWSSTEDQVLCRAWLEANEVQLQSTDHRTASFWSAVQQFFQQEMPYSTERPLNGLKIRWTRINRDSQKFMGIFNEVRDRERQESDGEASPELEQQWIDQAKTEFRQTYGAKFPFEGCWKLLRHASCWLQLLDSSSGRAPVLSNNIVDVDIYRQDDTPSASTPTTPAEATETEEPEPGESNEPTVITTTHSSANFTIAPRRNPEPAVRSPPLTSAPVEEPTEPAVDAVAASASPVIAAAVSTIITPPTATPEVATSAPQTNSSIRKRRSSNDPSSPQFRGLTGTLVDEIKRHNALLEDQNAIALLRVDVDMIPDTEGRQAFQSLRSRYLKKMRTSFTDEDGDTSDK